MHVAAPEFPKFTTQTRFVSRIGSGLTNSSGLASLCLVFFLIFMLWESWWSFEKLHLESGTRGVNCAEYCLKTVFETCSNWFKCMSQRPQKQSTTEQ